MSVIGILSFDVVVEVSRSVDRSVSNIVADADVLSFLCRKMLVEL